MGPAAILVPHAHAVHGSTLRRLICSPQTLSEKLCLQVIGLTRAAKLTFHVRYPMQPLCVLQPLNYVSHENSRAHHGIKCSRRLFSCLAHTYSAWNHLAQIILQTSNPFRKDFVYRSLTPHDVTGNVTAVVRNTHFYLKKFPRALRQPPLLELP